jgi:hypothetical protein
MPSTNPHGLVTAYHRDDNERWRKVPPADILGGNCVSCGCNVFVNVNGASALRERDADLICRRCDRLYGADADRSLIES